MPEFGHRPVAWQDDSQSFELVGLAKGVVQHRFEHLLQMHDSSTTAPSEITTMLFVPFEGLFMTHACMMPSRSE